MKKILTLSAVLMLIAACNNRYSYSSGKDFEDNRWPKAEILHFEITSPGKSAPATISLTYSHVADPQFTNVPVEIVITAPNGGKETIPLVLHLKDRDGKALSDCVGDVCDFETVVKKIEVPQEGKYKIDISNGFNGPYLPNTIAVGVKFTTF